MRSNSLLRQLVQATLSERRMQPVQADKLIIRLNTELLQLFRQPEVWQEVLARTQSHVGNPDPKVIEDLAEMAVEEVGEAARKAESYVIVNVPLRFLVKDTQKIANKIDELVRDIGKRYGWLVISARYDSRRNQNLIIQLERNYGDRLQPADIPTFLFHTTPIWNVEKILRKGLLPKKPSHNSHDEDDDWNDEKKDPIKTGRQYPPRVYLTSSKSLAGELSLSFQGDAYAEAMMTGSTSGIETYILLKIDARKLLPGTKLYVDNELDNSQYHGTSFWTYTRIPTRAISIDSQDEKDYQRFLAAIEEDDF